MQRRDRVFIFGAGKVGRALAKALAKGGVRVSLRAARRGLPKKPIDADVIVLAVRDRELARVASELADARGVSPKSVVVHVAGALGSEALAPLRGLCAGVAQMHPMISFASRTFAPSLARGNVHVEGDPVATARARALARALGMTPRTIPNLDPVAYHAAAGLVANGAAALAAAGCDVLASAGVDRETAQKMLGPLLRSVAENVERLGFPDALTGPVRRGDAAAVARAHALLATRAPAAARLLRATIEAQIPLAEALGEGAPQAWSALRDWVRSGEPENSPPAERSRVTKTAKK